MVRPHMRQGPGGVKPIDPNVVLRPVTVREQPAHGGEEGRHRRVEPVNMRGHAGSQGVDRAERCGKGEMLAVVTHP